MEKLNSWMKYDKTSAKNKIQRIFKQLTYYTFKIAVYGFFLV